MTTIPFELTINMYITYRNTTDLTSVTVNGIRNITEIISKHATALQKLATTMTELTTIIHQAGTDIGEIAADVAQVNHVQKKFPRVREERSKVMLKNLNGTLATCAS